MTDFATWWSNEGSAMRPRPDEDVEEFAKRVTQIAWSNGEYVEREACAKVCDSWSLRDSLAADMAEEIRARGQQ